MTSSSEVLPDSGPSPVVDGSPHASGVKNE